jgi:predicted TIM-barrel fold metal-dependent hydrolase
MTICDAHVHIIGAQDPQSPDRTYTAVPAALPDLARLAAPLGVGRFVVVQPSFYGTDNRVLLRALDALGGGRGVAVIDPAAAHPDELAAMARQGVRGLRINLYSSMSRAEDGLLERLFADMAAAAHGQGWHVEVIAPIRMLAAAAPMLAGAAVPVVLDHYGLHAGAAPEDAAVAALLGLLRRPHVWMKLSAPYRSSDDALAVRPDAAWLAALLDAGGDRCVWGSDWPHTPVHALQTGDQAALPHRVLDYAAVLNGFRASLPRGPSADAILQRNPARLYGFE